MSNETVTRVTADASGYTAELDRAGRSAQAFLKTQDDAARRTQMAQQAIAEAAANGSNASSRAINQFIKSLSNQSDAAGKSTADLLRMRAAQLGVSDAAEASIAKIEAAAAAQKVGSEAAHSFSLNTGAARRELAVLAHEASQGNWQKLGGSFLVLAERADFLSALFSPLALAIATVGGVTLGVAYEVIKGATAFDQLNRSAALTNGYLGLTGSQLEAMAQGLSGTTSSIVSVEQAMSALVSSGKIAGDQLELATKVTEGFAQDTGIAVDKAAEAMVKFSEDPKKALEDLQGQYHLFSAAQVEVIEGYLRTGDSAAAYMAILQGMDEAHRRFKDGAVENLGIVQRLFNFLKEDAAWELTQLQQIGVAASNADKLTAALQRQTAAQRNLAQAKAMPFGNTTSAQAGLEAANAQVAAYQKVADQQRATADAQRQRAAGGDAQLRVSKYLDSTQYASPLDQRNLAIKKENADFNATIVDVDHSSAQYESILRRHGDNLKQIEKEYESRNGSKAAASAAAAAAQNAINAQLAALDAQDKAVETGLKTSLDHVKSLRDQGLISEEDALKQSHDARQKALEQQLAIQQQQEQIAEGKKQKSAMEKYAGDVKATQDKLTSNDQQYTDDAAKLAAKRSRDLQAYTDSLTQQLQTQQQAADQALAGLSMGSVDRADFDKLSSLRQDYDRKVASLTKSLTENQIGRSQYDAELAATQDYYNQSVAIAQRSSADIRAANADWTTGAKRAIADYADQAANVASSVASTFQDAFRGMEDAFATFVTTGKLSFSSLATSVISDIARMEARAAISGLFSFAQSALGSAFGGGDSAAAAPTSYAFHLAGGGHVSGPGTSTSDSIPAWLSDGEYVLKADAVRRVGRSNLDAINGGQRVDGWRRFASGGYVDSAKTSPAGGGGVIQMGGITVQGGNTDGSSQADALSLAGNIDRRMRQVALEEITKANRQGGINWKLRTGGTT